MRPPASKSRRPRRPGAGVGAALGGTAGLLAGLGIIAIPGLGPVVAAGALAATAVGAAAGAATGGVVGALVSAGVPEQEAHVYCEAVRRGGTMVTVRVADDQVALAERIMDGHGPISAAERRTTYTGEGWKRFDPAGGALSPDPGRNRSGAPALQSLGAFRAPLRRISYFAAGAPCLAAPAMVPA